jgi:hypothetical protein
MVLNLISHFDDCIHTLPINRYIQICQPFLYLLNVDRSFSDANHLDAAIRCLYDAAALFDKHVVRTGRRELTQLFLEQQ